MQTAGEVVLGNEYRFRLNNAIQNLPGQAAGLVWLLYLGEITVKKAAGILGCNRKAIQTSRKVIRKVLHNMMLD